MAGFPGMDEVWSVRPQDFDQLALDVFHRQSKDNEVYAQFLSLIDKRPERIKEVHQIPYLPIAFFKTHEVRTGHFEPASVFESSSTTGTGLSRHAIRSLEYYHATAQRIFEDRFGPLSERSVLGLLPNYLERPSSSLVSMVRRFNTLGRPTAGNGFFLYDHEGLRMAIEQSDRPILFGVSFALLDLLEEGPILKEDLMVVETGGMKGRRRELSRSELTNIICKGFPNANVYSEYGMTELTSQAYGGTDGRYTAPTWMRVSCRLDTDPLSRPLKQGRGAINIIDLANLDSCSFIATDDMGRVHADGTFEVLGRMDHADLRGCGLMIDPTERDE